MATRHHGPGQNRRGRGGTGVHRLTVIRPGPIGDAGMHMPSADMYVDCFQYLSAHGLDAERQRDPRGNIARTRDESHIQRRTRGKRGGAIQDSRTHRKNDLAFKE